MSRTVKSEHTQSPVEFKLEWVGHEEGGYFKTWDKEQKCEVLAKLPLRFAYLDCTKAIGGFLENVSRSPYSNEVRNTQTEPFNIRYYKDGNQHPVATGLWADIKGDVPKGTKFVNVIYATLLTKCDVADAGTLVKLPFLGSAGSAWIDLQIKDGESFEVSGFVDKKKGRTNYRAPVFARIDITEEEGETADKHDELVQEYLNSVLDSSKTEAASVEVASGAEVPDSVTDAGEAMLPEEDEIPF